MSGDFELHPEGKGFKRGSRVRSVFDPNGSTGVATLWTPNELQAAALASDVGIDLIVGGLGSGKSDVGALKLLMWALRNPRRKDGSPTKWLILGPDFAFLKDEQMQKILDQASRLDGAPYETVVKRVVLGQNPKIVLCHDQELLCRSGTEPKRMRGHQFSGMWMDEAEFQHEAAFSMAITRMRSAEAIRAVVTTSPQTVRNSWVWPLVSGTNDGYNAVRETVEVRVHRWRSRDNKANEPEVLEAIGAVLEATTPGASAQELDGLFLGTHEAPDRGVFDFQKAFVPRLNLTESEMRAAVLGVDLGKQHDFTWLTVMSRTGVVLFMDRFNASTIDTERKTFYTAVQDRIVALVAEFAIPLVKIDTAMQGASFTDMLRTKLGSRARVDGYGTDAPKRKAQAIEALGMALSRVTIKIPEVWVAPGGLETKVGHVAQLKRELVELQVEERDGYRVFDHPQGGHDDGIVSLALAYSGVATRGYEVDLSPWLKKGKFQVPGSKWATPFGPGFNLGGMRPFPPTRPPGPSGR
jgi:hypothetical protein